MQLSAWDVTRRPKNPDVTKHQTATSFALLLVPGVSGQRTLSLMLFTYMQVVAHSKMLLTPESTSSCSSLHF